MPQQSMSETVADQRLARNRFDLEALLAKGDHHFARGDHRGAAGFYAFAAKSFDPAVSPEALRAAQMRDWLADRFRDHIVSGLEQAGFSREDWPPRFRAALQIMFGERERDLVSGPFPQLPRLFFYPDLPYVDFADVTQFPWRKELESRYREMRDEAAALLADTADFSPYVQRSKDYPQGDVYGLVENPQWSSLYLWESGQPVQENAARCPRTFEALNDLVPQCEIGGKFPVVLFSLLQPGAHIPPHNGMLNIQYICHLPLIVPPGCSFRVGERTVEWREGEMLAFDDTVEHEARNDSGQDRLILLFYIWNPHLSDDEKLIVRRMLEIVHNYR